MATMLDCIERIPELLEKILSNKDKTFRALFDYIGEDFKTIHQIVLVGSGTSNTASLTASYFMEKTTGIEVKAVVPSVFCANTHVFHEDTLYIFISQTGTSMLTRKAQQLVKEKGLRNICMSESAQTPAAKEASCFLDMGCGFEEQPMRTIGYSTTVYTLMLLAISIGKQNKTIDQSEYDSYMEMAGKLLGDLQDVVQETLCWLQNGRQWQIMRSAAILFTGAGALYGVAQEASVKIWETPKYTSFGYELEEGMHGPNFGYDSRHCVIVLNDGGADNEKALSLARYMKEVFHNGLVIGSVTVDENDLKLSISCGSFGCLVFACVAQVMAYKLALDEGRDMVSPHDNSVMNSYFITHSEQK